MRGAPLGWIWARKAEFDSEGRIRVTGETNVSAVAKRCSRYLQDPHTFASCVAWIVRRVSGCKKRRRLLAGARNGRGSCNLCGCNPIIYVDYDETETHAHSLATALCTRPTLMRCLQRSATCARRAPAQAAAAGPALGWLVGGEASRGRRHRVSRLNYGCTAPCAAISL